MSANRDAFELQEEDRQLGKALARLLVDLDLEEAKPFLNPPYWIPYFICFSSRKVEYFFKRCGTRFFVDVGGKQSFMCHEINTVRANRWAKNFISRY